MSRGIIYCAQGDWFFREALISCRSSLQHNQVRHIVYTDRDPTISLEGVEFAFQRSCGVPYADKIEAMSRSPFDRTIFLDTDTYVAAAITGLFDLLERFDMAAAHAPGYLGLDDPEVPQAFYELNSGVVAYRRTPGVTRLLADWRATYLAWLDQPPFEDAAQSFGHDQPALRRCLWKSALSLYVLGPEFNYRTIQPGRLVGSVKVIHGRATDYPALVSDLDRDSGPRVFPAFTEL